MIRFIVGRFQVKLELGLRNVRHDPMFLYQIFVHPPKPAGDGILQQDKSSDDAL